MTQEESRDQVVGLQNTAKQIKEHVGMLRSDINKLMGETKGYQKGYEAGLAEGRKQAEEHDGCVGCAYESRGMDEEPCIICKGRYVDQYRRADDEIRVGDEVIAALTHKSGYATVTKVRNEKEALYFYADGTTGWDDLSELKKTGRHFPEVEKLLEAMRK